MGWTGGCGGLPWGCCEYHVLPRGHILSNDACGSEVVEDVCAIRTGLARGTRSIADTATRRVTPQHVHNVKAISGKRSIDQLGALIEAKKLADKLGSVDRAREALNASAKLL